MNVSKMVRLVALTAVGLLAACGESTTTAPAAAKAPEKIRVPFDVQLAPAAGVNADLLGGSLLPSGSTTITIDPTRSNMYLIGAHWLYVPAGSVCALTSSYGPSEWNNDCVAATSPITLTATYGSVDGKAVIEFSKDMRFKPSTSPFKWVLLFMREPNITDLSKYSVWYKDNAGNLVNEAASDPDLRALRLNGSYIVRRVKHFSGYVIRLGFEGEGECNAELSESGICGEGTSNE